MPPDSLAGMVQVSRPFRGLRSNCAGAFVEADPWPAWLLAAGAERDPVAILKKDALFSGRQAESDCAGLDGNARSVSFLSEPEVCRGCSCVPSARQRCGSFRPSC